MVHLVKRSRLSILRAALTGSFLLVTLVSVMVFTPALARKPVPPPGKPKEAPPVSILGVAANGHSSLPGISWVRLGYSTCGTGNLNGAALQQQIHSYHASGFKVLLTICQPHSSQLFNKALLQDAAKGHADAVQCGNEQMKYDPGLTSYVAPAQFARFFDLCQAAVRSKNSRTTVLLGSLDPHVARVDFNQLNSQIQYLNSMQWAMNNQVHRGGRWTWRSQILGLINSWHDGFPSLYVNNLQDLFFYWARALQVAPQNLGQHLWVVEDTGCFKGCGVNVNSKAQVAIAHILALIVDTQTTQRFNVPFFFFSARDFFASGSFWPIGILDIQGRAKPLRQDLKMGSRALVMICGKYRVTVYSQEQLLSRMYQGCYLPGNYYYAMVH